MAAHAAAIHDDDVIIVSKARKSYMRGAQYLHRPIPLSPGEPPEPFRVRYLLRGSADAYRAKVYGPDYRGPVSPEDLTEDHEAWDIRETYDALWDSYGKFVIDEDLSRAGKIHALAAWARPDFYISTVPAPLLCEQPHVCAFRSEDIWSNDMEVMAMSDNSVICNGEKAPAWYRSSKIQGHTTVEWPHWSRPPISVTNVVKPLSTTCECNPDIERMGRYGEWKKGVLSHSAFYNTVDLLLRPQQMGLFE